MLIPPDVSPSDSYYEAVKYVLAQGYFSGTDDGRFDPSGELTRAQLSQVLWTMGGSLNSKMSQFSDVTSNDWFYRSVSWCQQEELIAGYSTTTFAPDDRLSREQMISILLPCVPPPTCPSSPTRIRSPTGRWTAYAGLSPMG